MSQNTETGKFIKKIYDIYVPIHGHKKIDNLFKNLTDNEKKFGFTERLGKEKFFRKGLVDEWKNVLKENLVKKIEKEFFEEMKELKYL